MAATRTEFDLIARIRERAGGTRADVMLGIGDDAAVLRVPSGHDLVVSTDTLNFGVHFPVETLPADIGWKSLAVNLSDLAAMGAQPAWCTLNLTLPEADGEWLSAFLDGFLALAAQHDVALVGGDTTRGPLSITVTVHGLVPHGAALRRDGAQVGDFVCVTGTLGDAAGGLALLSPSPLAGEGDELRLRDASGISRSEERPTGPELGRGGEHLRDRLDRPVPRVALGLALRGIASSCIDVSDGLLVDLGHILDASGVGAQVELDALPISPELASAFDGPTRRALQFGGDDYELCFTAPLGSTDEVTAVATKVGVPVTRIGRIEAQRGLRLREADGNVHVAARAGYEHFRTERDK